jgi:hypothetical protein
VCSSSSFFWNALGRQSRRGAREEEEEEEDEEEDDAASEEEAADTSSLPVGAAFCRFRFRVWELGAGRRELVSQWSKEANSCAEAGGTGKWKKGCISLRHETNGFLFQCFFFVLLAR